MVSYLEKSAGSEGFEQIIDFLSASHIHYAFTTNPTIYTSLIQKFWETAALCTMEDGVQAISATIDRKVKVLVSEASIRRHLKLEDSEGLSSLPNAEIFEQLANMGYVTDSDSLTFQKGHFSLQWKFFIHTILHCLSPKKTAWDQFSSNIATTIICLATNRIFNFSKFLFEAMVPYWQWLIRIAVKYIVLLELYLQGINSTAGGKAKDKGKEIMQDLSLQSKHRNMVSSSMSMCFRTTRKLEQGKKAEVRKNMITYLKNQGGYKMSYFKVSLDLSRLATTLNRLERSIKSGIYTVVS
ncbi:hypothetical protein Tco_0976230 [Tanacetum coccineum]|uniref:Uncharacterized protein n=1 Tax=Tanacetum coccineum TaxID=301880 RepID=A0ABQ5EGM5_9ASTR